MKTIRARARRQAGLPPRLGSILGALLSLLVAGVPRAHAGGVATMLRDIDASPAQFSPAGAPDRSP